MSLKKLLKIALTFTGDNLSDLVFFREPDSASDADRPQSTFNDTINLDPTPCTFTALAGEINPPSFIAYSATYIYYYLRDVDPAGDKFGVLRVIRRTGRQVVEIPHQKV
jgi:hypothetical protein